MVDTGHILQFLYWSFAYEVTEIFVVIWPTGQLEYKYAFCHIIDGYIKIEKKKHFLCRKSLIK